MERENSLWRPLAAEAEKGRSCPQGAHIREQLLVGFVNDMADKTENEATQKPVCTFSFKKRGRVKNTRKRRASDEEGLLYRAN